MIQNRSEEAKTLKTFNHAINSDNDQRSAWLLVHEQEIRTLLERAAATPKTEKAQCEHEGHCPCDIGTRHFWFNSFCEEREKLHALAKTDRDIALAEQRCIGHGEGQEHTIADVNAGLVDDLIAPRLNALRQEITQACQPGQAPYWWQAAVEAEYEHGPIGGKAMLEWPVFLAMRAILNHLLGTTTEAQHEQKRTTGDPARR